MSNKWVDNYDDIYEHPPVKEGYVRMYEDHTGRYYTDITIEEYESQKDDPFLQILNEEIRKELDNDLLDKIRNAAKELNIPVKE